MAATALDVLPLTRVRAELEIPEGEGDDLYLTGLAGAAVHAVESHTRLPLVQRRERYAGVPDPVDGIVYLVVPHIQMVFDLRWHEAGQRYAEQPTGRDINPDCRVDMDAENAAIHPPAATGQWPDLIPGGRLWFDVILQVLRPPENVIQAAVIALRQMYDGMAFRPDGAFLNLLHGLDRLPERHDPPLALLHDSIPYVPLTPDTPSVPVVTPVDFRFGTSADATPEAAELTVESRRGQVIIPAYEGERHWLFARLSSEDGIKSIRAQGSPLNQIGAFAKWADPVTVGGDGYSVWVSRRALTNAAPGTWEVS